MELLQTRSEVLAFLNEHGVKGRIMAARSVDDTFAAMVTNTIG